MGSNLYIAASGAVSRLHQLEIVANNLANADSAAFKADRALFHTALESAVFTEGNGETSGAAGSVYVDMAAIRSNHAPGPIRRTDAPLDVAIDGPGFFAVETPEGERYTRAGSFAVGAEGDLRTPEGLVVLGTGGSITVAGAARILSNGEIVDGNGRVTGQLKIVEFEDTGVLSKEGNGLFRAPEEAERDDADAPTLIEGSVEGSNVQPVVEMAVLMMLQRAFDASMQAMQSEDGATQRLIQEMSR